MSSVMLYVASNSSTSCALSILAAVDGALTGRDVDDVGVRVHHVSNRLCKFSDRDALAGSDVESFSDGVVAGLFSVALDGDVVASARLVAEDT